MELSHHDDGTDPALSAATEEADGSAPAVCREPADFYAPAGRDGVGRFCRRFLDENALTATELLHHPRHQISLSNTATFVAILTQAERAMERPGGQKGALTPLVNEIARLTRERLKENPPPDFLPGAYPGTAAELLSNGGFLGRFLLDAAITHHIATGRSFAEKALSLLALAATTEHPDALVPLERLLGEIMLSDAGTASCARDAPFVTLIDLIVTLIAADRPMPDDAPPVFRRLDALMRRVPMPALREALTAAFRREMAKPACFTIASAGDMFGIEAVQREILALSDLSARLRDREGNYAGGARTEAALQRRTALLVNEDTVPEITRGRNFMQKLRILFVLQKMPLSPTAAKAVTDYLKSFFDSRDFAGRLLDCWKDRNEKLKGLAEVQRMVQSSAFPEEEREYLAGQIDDIQNAFLRTQRVLAPLIQAKDDPPADSVLDIVRLAGEGAFCSGKSRLAAARVLYRHCHRPRFVRHVLLNAPGPKERAARAGWLRQSLAMVGVPFIDLAAQRVLVVDDEDGPRAFVTSVLRELGIGQVDTAVDGQDALQRFQADAAAYDLIVCDWMMPRLSGLDLLKHVRETRSDLPFLMVTALATLEAVKKALAHHVSGYIAKPFTPDQLEEKIFLVLAQKGIGDGA
ncbi:response regulator [Azospirillum lipoferum]|uniref:Two-component response regulator (CheY-like) n=1 Tax=Azospirillum lipoferum (strain 4B) TaxID=862719 RepID=G7Z5V4_AZOL4|nr:response regulator [Azospirillum lipoferum]CBS86328.1 two-component response regulator (CheY-like) [Azospirillum lipoferum 4B]